MPDSTNHRVARALTNVWALVLFFLAAVACGSVASSDPVTGNSTTVNPKPATTVASLEKTTASADAEVFFPQQATNSDFMLADLRGRLILDDEGCLRLDVATGRPGMLVWPADFGLSVDGGNVRILDENDQTAGIVGQPVRLGGGEVSREVIEQNGLQDDRMLPELFRRCPGPYWLAGL